MIGHDIDGAWLPDDVEVYVGDKQYQCDHPSDHKKYQRGCLIYDIPSGKQILKIKVPKDCCSNYYKEDGQKIKLEDKAKNFKFKLDAVVVFGPK